MRACRELAQHRLPLSILQIERQRLLVEIERLKIDALAVPQEVRPHRPRGIAPAPSVARRRLDLDHLGPQLRQELRPVRPRAILLGRKDSEAGEGQFRHAGFRFTHCRAMMMRCISLVPSPMHISSASR